MCKRLLLLCVFTFCLSRAWSQEDDSAIRPAQCYLPSEEMQRIECFRLIVPQFRDGRGSSSGVMDLFVLRIHARVATDNAPILIVPGGPGEAASLTLHDWLTSELGKDHDIILLDVRGTGLSLPSLYCRDTNHDDRFSVLRACRARFADQGLDLAAFSLSAILMDYADLLSLLELPQVNVYGHSYGSQLALMLAELVPERIRSLALDGLYPPSVHHTTELARNLHLALNRLFADCANDPDCKGAYPNLSDAFYRVVMELNASPKSLRLHGRDIGFTMTGDDFVLLVASLLQETGAISRLPAFIVAIASGEYDLAPFLDSRYFAGDKSYLRNEGTFLTLRCPEDLALPEAERYPTALDETSPLLAAAMRNPVAHHYAACQAWDVPASERIEGPVRSAIPSLLMSGAYDPATPPLWGEFAARHLSNSWHFVFPHAGHGILESLPCATGIMAAFLSDPLQNPSAPCFTELGPPRFVISTGNRD